MSKRSIKSPCVWFKSLMLLQFFDGRKTRFAHAITVNKRTASHNFRTYIWISYTDFLCHLKLNRGKSTWTNRRWKWLLLSLWSLIVFEENIVVIVICQRLLGSPLNLTLSLRKYYRIVSVKPFPLICITSSLYTIYH